MRNMEVMKKINWWLLALCVLGTLALGALSALLGGSMVNFDGLNRPLLTPPSMVFAIVWPILYALIGLSLYIILMKEPSSEMAATLKKVSIWLWVAQMVVNVLWTLFFFRLELYMFSFFWLALLVAIVASLFVANLKLEMWAGWALLPYLLWICFAAYLNLMIALFN